MTSTSATPAVASARKAGAINPLYRTLMCGDARKNNVGADVTLSGWIFRRRDHGGVVFIDLRDTTGLVQVVFKPDVMSAEAIETITHTGMESVIQVEGKVIPRGEGLENANLPTGEIEIEVHGFKVLGAADPLPYSMQDDTVPEDLRLTYRFLDLRREDVSNTIKMRSDVIASMRRRMWELGFREFQTPILTASSPEGARDFLVPSRLHPGKFYALPQAPQQFKQLLMVSGFDRYFQIAPCFRDEDARADRCPTDFYQLDMEMSFVQQEDIFAVVEHVLGGVFTEFSGWNGNFRNDSGRTVDGTPWVHIPFDTAMMDYACDKPDLRCPLKIVDVSDVWAASDFGVFKGIVESKGHVRMIGVPGATKQPRSWFDTIGKWAQDELGAPAAPGYITWKDEGFGGPLTKFLKEEQIRDMFARANVGQGGAIFFVAGKTPSIYKILNPLRVRLGKDNGLNETGVFKFCWIVDFPMFEQDEATGKIDFSHNPFSMPQGGLEALQTKNPLEIYATQYDLVCNGYELISGGLRNHLPEAMIKAFEIAGYSADTVKDKFRGMWKAFHLGTPPHGGCAVGIERAVMLLAESNMVREVVAFPMTQRGEDLLMGAPTVPTEAQLKELHIKVR
jgi:aspartyl-tRNA synthetase